MRSTITRGPSDVSLGAGPSGLSSVVLGVAFLVWLPIDIWRSAHGKHYVFSNALLLKSTAWEILLFGAVLWIGRVRGWSLVSLGTRISWKGTFGGILLHILVVAVD